MLPHFAMRADRIKRVKHHKFWEDGGHAILLDANEKWDQRLNYLHNNPAAAGIVAEPQHYLQSSAGDCSGIKGLVEVEPVW